MICSCRRRRRIARRDRPASSTPSWRIDPDVGSSSRSMVRPSVLLPQPLSPITPSVSPRRICRLTPLTA
jgi:hypothetical protein